MKRTPEELIAHHTGRALAAKIRLAKAKDVRISVLEAIAADLQRPEIAALFTGDDADAVTVALLVMSRVRERLVSEAVGP